MVLGHGNGVEELRGAGGGFTAGQPKRGEKPLPR